MSRGTISGEQVTLHLQGVNLDDDRWENPASRLRTHRHGVWELLTGTEVLPRFSGGRVSAWEVPGGQGERRAALIPLSARLIPIRVGFLPICTDPSDPRYQQEGRDPQERAYFLRQNIAEFMRRVQVARSMVDGDLRLDRTVGGTEQQSCGVYFESDWSQEDEDGFYYSTLTIIARNRTGTWHGPWEYVDAGELSPGQTYGVTVPMGDAPVEDARIAIRPTGSAPGVNNQFFDVTNLGGTGFRAARLSPWNRWWIFRTDESRAGHHNNSDIRDWTVPTDREDVMFSIGRSQGTSLLIPPGIPGDGRPVGQVNIRVGAPARVMIAIRPKNF